MASHQNFREKHNLTEEFLSDPEHSMIEAYGAWGVKKMYGKETRGVVRSSVLVDAEGLVRHVWLKARSKGHAQEVLDYLKRLYS